MTSPSPFRLALFWDFVLRLNSAGFHPAVIPLGPGRKPAVKWRDWPAHEIATMFKAGYVPPGIEGAGLLTGARSGGLVVLDVDYKPPVDGFATLDALEQRHGPLPATLQVRSPSGGLHVYLAAPPGACYQTQAGKLGPGIDVRAEGGLVVAPGSWHSKRGGYYMIEPVSS